MISWLLPFLSILMNKLNQTKKFFFLFSKFGRFTFSKMFLLFFQIKTAVSVLYWFGTVSTSIDIALIFVDFLILKHYCVLKES